VSSGADPTSKILEWAAKQDLWLQDALRRLTQTRTLSETDRADILQMVKARHDLVKPESAPKAVPISLDHLTDSAEHPDTLHLKSLGNIQHANNLAPGQILPFCSTLTVVYGENASGKSGYARIIKNAAGARGWENHPVLGNVFEMDEDVPPSPQATFVVRFGDAEPINLPWIDHAILPDMKRVRVFDTRTATIYVGSESELAFEPFGLDLLESLTGELNLIREHLGGEIQTEEKNCIRLVDSLPKVGTAADFVQGLTSQTTAAQIAAATAWTEEKDEQRLCEVKNLIEQAGSVARGLRNQKARCVVLLARVKALETFLSENWAATLQELVTDAVTKRQAAVELSTEAFGREPLPGVGGIPWRIMWDAAVDYHKGAAYPDREFPVTEGDDAFCLLCQQPLGEPARQRFQRFHDHVAGVIARQSQEAERKYQTALDTLGELSPGITADDIALFDDVGKDNLALADALNKFFLAAGNRKSGLERALQTQDFTNLEGVPSQVSAGLSTYINDLEKRATVADGAVKPEEQQKLLDEHNELAGRKALKGHITTIKGVVKGKRAVASLNVCHAALKTNAISKEKGRLRELLVDTEFNTKLKGELKELEVRQNVKLGFRSPKDGTKQYTQFQGAKVKPKEMEDVLSEGEFRAVALACFLAEAGQVPGNAPLVIDDPVSSLDHERRKLVARRLAREAKDRQVIVFTHDLAFYNDLADAAGELQVPWKQVEVTNSPEGYGYVRADEVPWERQSVTTRLKKLEDDLPRLEALYNSGDSSYAEQSEHFCVQLRKTWERFVEADVLNGVVTRFGYEIKTLSLKRAVVTDDLYEKIFWGVKRVNPGAHDGAPAAKPPPLKPTELKECIASLRQLREDTKQAAKKMEEERKKRENPPKAKD